MVGETPNVFLNCLLKLDSVGYPHSVATSITLVSLESSLAHATFIRTLCKYPSGDSPQNEINKRRSDDSLTKHNLARLGIFISLPKLEFIIFIAG